MSLLNYRKILMSITREMIMSGIEWITVKKLSEETGYTEKAIQEKVTQGKWPQGLVWRHAPDGRRLFSKKGYNKWAESKPLMN